MQCHACQACNRPQNLKAPLIHFPIPPRIMASVAMDVFHMPNTKYDGEFFDAMVVYIDRHSGWMVAVPCRKKGLTGSKVAKKCSSANGKYSEFRA